MRSKLVFILLLPLFCSAQSQFSFAVVKYSGGGDWYANPTAVTNLAQFCRVELDIPMTKDYDYVELSSPDIFNYPILFLTGHGNIVLSEAEKKNLNTYLRSGGFIHIDDNYGLDEYIRPEISSALNGAVFEELAADHPLFSTPYSFPRGLPKIHEHEGKSPQAFALYLKGRMVCLYTYESDLNDGWEDPEVHNDPESLHIDALRMGANIVSYVFNGQ